MNQTMTLQSGRRQAVNSFSLGKLAEIHLQSVIDGGDEDRRACHHFPDPRRTTGTTCRRAREERKDELPGGAVRA